MRCLRQACRAVDGVTIVEMVVASAILAIVMGGMTMTVMNSLNLSRQNANRIVAANLAASEVDRLRTTPFDELALLVADGDGDVTETRVVDDRTYEVSRSIYWSANDADLGPCPGTIDAADENVLRIEVEVTWTRTMGVRPVRSDAWVAPPLGLYEISGGSMAVYVADHQVPGQPVAGVSVVLYGPTDITGAAQSRTGMTDADGCAVFDDLTPGAYRAAIGLAGYIDIDQREAVLPLPTNAATGVTQEAGVAVRSRSWMEFRYAPAGTATVTAAGWAGGRLPVTSFGWYAANTRGSFGRATLGAAGTLYPGEYGLWAGTCPDADPEAVNPSDDTIRIWPDAERVGSVSITANGTQTATATIASLDVVWEDEVELDPTRTVALRADHTGAIGCDGGVTQLDLGTTVVGEDLRLALPYGSWRITATEIGVGELGQRDAVLDPREVSDVPEVRFDAPEVAPPPPPPPPPGCELGPPTYVGHTAIGITTTNPRDRTIAVPAGVQVGDLLVLEAYVHQGESYGVPSGWTQRSSRQQQAGGSTRLIVWTRLATSADLGASVTMTRPNSLPGGVALLTAYRDVASDVPMLPGFEREVVSNPSWSWNYYIDFYNQVAAPATHTDALYVLSAGYNRGDDDFRASGPYWTATPTPRPLALLFPSGNPLTVGPPWASLLSLHRSIPGGDTVAQSAIGWSVFDRGASHLLVFPAGCEVD